MKSLFYFILLFSIVACSNTGKKNDSTKNTENKDANINELHGSNSSQSLNSSLIQGVWAENKEDNALFYIKGDSLYYVESIEKPLFCKLNQDTLVAYGDILTKYYIKKLTDDSLWFSTDYFDGVTKLYKRK